MSKYTSCTYYSSINSVFQEDLSKKLRGNSLITYKSSLNNITNDEKTTWMSIVKQMNEGKNEGKNDTKLLIDDLNFKKYEKSSFFLQRFTKIYIAFLCEKDEISTKDNFSKEIDTMPSVREEYKQKFQVKPSLEPNLMTKNTKPIRDLLYENLSERTVFLNEKLQKSQKKPELSKSPIGNPPLTSKPKLSQIINEEVPNPLKKMRILKEERRLSRISSRTSFEDPLKEIIAQETKDLAITIKDFSKPFDFKERENELEFDFKQKEKAHEEINTKNSSDTYDYIERFLNHRNPLRNTHNNSIYNNDNDKENENNTPSSLACMKSYFKNMRNLKINVDAEQDDQEKFFNSRICFSKSSQKSEYIDENMRNLLYESSALPLKEKKIDNNNYDINNFINDMMEIYQSRQKDPISTDTKDFLESEKENLNMKLKCLSPVYRELKISARGNDQKTQKTHNKRNSVHESSCFDHRKSGMFERNCYQKNRDFSQFSKHFTGSESLINETYRGDYINKGGSNIRKNVY